MPAAEVPLVERNADPSLEACLGDDLLGLPNRLLRLTRPQDTGRVVARVVLPSQLVPVAMDGDGIQQMPGGAKQRQRPIAIRQRRDKQPYG